MTIDQFSRDPEVFLMEEMAPFLSPSLTSLHIDPVELFSGQPSELLSALPNLRHIKLKRQGFLEHFDAIVSGLDSMDIPSGMTLECLDLIAQNCTKLESLEIGLVASDTTNLSRPKKGFSNLIYLNLNLSFINHKVKAFNAKRAALYISTFVTNSNVKIAYGDRFDPDSCQLDTESQGGEIFVRSVQEYYEFIAGFVSMLELAIEIRSDVGHQLVS